LFVVRADGDYLRALDIVGTRPVWFGGSARDIVPYTVYLPLARR
jgi:hypothetical protein